LLEKYVAVAVVAIEEAIGRRARAVEPALIDDVAETVEARVLITDIAADSPNQLLIYGLLKDLN
jgi:hypothetical protein